MQDTRTTSTIRGAASWLFPGLTALLLTTASCGGGGGNGNGQPNSQPNFPDPVEEVVAADLSNAGIPDVATLGGISSVRSASLALAGDWNGDGSIDGSDFKLSHNIDVQADGTGIELKVPEGENTRRIVGWAMYELPGRPDSHLAWMQSNFLFGDGTVHWFYAVANAGRQSWEIGGALDDSGLESRHYITDGTSNILSEYNFRRSFSMGEDYVFANGSSYVLLLAGHPGNANVSGYINNTELWDWRRILDSASEGFGEGQNGSCSWDFSGEGGGIYNSIIAEFSYVEQNNLYKQYFTASPPQQATMLFAQPFNLLPDGEPIEPSTALNDVDGDDYLLWRYGFFNPGEMNGWQHPFLLERDGEGPGALTAAPLLQLPGGQQTNGIIAILIALSGPIPDADVSLLTADDEISLKTGKAGQLLIPLSFFGTDTFTYTLVYNGGQEPLSYELLVDRQAGIYRIH